MTGLALLLVTVAAVFHACWNLLTKQSGDKLIFLWWTGVAGTLVLLPAVLWLTPSWRWPADVWGGIGLAAALRATYFASLGTAYGRGDFSLVYPLARGTAPVLVPPLAIVLLGERPSILGLTGVLTVAVGVYVLHLPGLAGRQWLHPFRAVRSAHGRWAVLTGLLTASYSIVDKWSMSRGVPPLAYAYLTIPLAGLLLTPAVLPRRAAARAERHVARFAIPVVAVLMPLGYLMVLFAMQLAPISYVAAARELGIVVSAVLGGLVLAEPHLAHRLAGAALIVLGVALLAV